MLVESSGRCKDQVGRRNDDDEQGEGKMVAVEKKLNIRIQELGDS